MFTIKYPSLKFRKGMHWSHEPHVREISLLLLAHKCCACECFMFDPWCHKAGEAVSCLIFNSIPCWDCSSGLECFLACVGRCARSPALPNNTLPFLSSSSLDAKSSNFYTTLYKCQKRTKARWLKTAAISWESLLWNQEVSFSLLFQVYWKWNDL
jgi:hypothetical protein